MELQLVKVRSLILKELRVLGVKDFWLHDGNNSNAMENTTLDQGKAQISQDNTGDYTLCWT